MVEQLFTITDKLGIHARPAGALVKVANQFQSDTKLAFNEKTVNLRSIIQLMSLGVKQGDHVKIIAEGTDENELMEEVKTVLQSEGLANLYEK